MNHKKERKLHCNVRPFAAVCTQSSALGVWVGGTLLILVHLFRKWGWLLADLSWSQLGSQFLGAASEAEKTTMVADAFAHRTT
eukprot:418447-Amphidinium_carterae.1